jgi:hypothetical protein
MGNDMSSVDAAFGFIPYGDVLRVQRYAVNTAPTVNIAPGDLLTAGGAVVSTPKGYLMDVDDGAVMDGTAAILGAVVAVEDEDGAPLSYMAAGRVGNGTIAGYVMIADHPMQLFLAQEDGDTNAIDLAEGSQNADAISATLAAPNTDTGRSTMEIDSTTAGTSADLNLKLIAPHPDDTPADDTNCHARWICQINEHYYGDTIAGV